MNKAPKKKKVSAKPHTVSARKRESLFRRYCDFSTLKDLFSQQYSQNQPPQAENKEEIIHVRPESKIPLHKTRSKSADFDVLLEKSGFEEDSELLYDGYESLDFEDNGFASLTSTDSRTESIEADCAGISISRTMLEDTRLAPNNSIDLGMLNKSIQNIPSQKPATNIAGQNVVRPHGMKLSRSCESLSLYEAIEHNNLNTPKLKSDKFLRVSASQSAVGQPRLLLESSLVPQLVQRYEALSPSKDLRSMKALSFAGDSSGIEANNSQRRREPIAKTTSLDSDVGVNFVQSWEGRKPRSFSADASDDPNTLYETAYTYEVISGYESVPFQGNLASFLPENTTVANFQ